MKRPSRFLLVGAVLSILLILAHAGVAQVATVRIGQAPKGEPVAEEPGKAPTAYVAETKTPPTIDGRLTEEVWNSSQVLHVVRTLDGSARAEQPTDIRLLRDAKHLYIGIRCAEPFADKIRATRRTRDEDLWADDSVELFIGTDDDFDYYHIIVNALGTFYDGFNKEKSWNGDIRAAGATGAKEWTVELAIGLESLKFPIPAGQPRIGTEVTKWIANFNRNRYTRGGMTELSWSPTMTGDSHVPRRFGKMLFEDPPKELLARPDAAVVPGVKFLASAEGEGVVQFDLSVIPKGAKVYRADLVAFRSGQVTGGDDESAVNIEILPLEAEFADGGRPGDAGQPLALRGPWFDRFDATEAVRAWLGGKPNGGFFVKAFPLWNQKATYLEIAYEGKPGKLPPPATMLKAVHRAGQTFLTWKEIEQRPVADGMKWGDLRQLLATLDVAGEVRYCVYRSAKPITADTLAEAECIARAKPLSCWNVSGRTLDRAIDELFKQYWLDHGQWNPFAGASVDGKFGLDCPMDRFVIADGEAPLPIGAGLYVHTAAAEGKAYYAVVSCVDGVENTAALSNENSLAEPVSETPAEPLPVFQGVLARRPFWDYGEARRHYVRWVAPPYGNLPYQYYNWMVAVPDKLGKEIKGPVPLELSLHRDGYGYYRTQYRLRRDSIVVAPYDFPLNTYWFGYHDALGTLKSFRQGLVHNYTERRVLWFVDWAAKTWPIDRNQITVTGTNGSAFFGVKNLARRHPEVFKGRDARGGRSSDLFPAMEQVWGKQQWKIQTETGKSVWDE